MCTGKPTTSKNDDESAVTEQCFASNTLAFAGNTSTLRYADMYFLGKIAIPDFTIPLVKTTEGTYPAGSEWVSILT